jgi:hypothetical protein
MPKARVEPQGEALSIYRQGPGFAGTGKSDDPEEPGDTCGRRDGVEDEWCEHARSSEQGACQSEVAHEHGVSAA